MKKIFIILSFLLPVSLSAQLLRSYGVVDIGSTFPYSTVNGAKFAYRAIDSSYYRWVSGNTWVKIIEPSIIPDTIYLTESIGTSYKVSGDTINLTPYLLKSDTTAMLVRYIERGDTLGMLSAYIRSAGWGLLKTAYTLTADSSKIATRYYTGANFFPLQGGTLTGTGGAGFFGFPTQSGTPSTPASGFKMYANGAHNLAILDRNGWITTFDISSTSNRFFTLPSTGGTFAMGTGTANLVPLWTATNILGNSNIQDNGTAVSILNSKPFVLGQWTTAGRPSGTAGYMGWRDGTTFEWHNGTRWAAGLESTAATFTAGSLIFANSNGQATQDNTNLFYNSSNYAIRLGASTSADRIEFGANNGSGIPYITLFNAGLSTATLSLSNTLSALQLNVGLDVAGVITTTSRFKSVGLASIGSGQSNTGNSAGGQLILRPNSGSPGYINFTENAVGFWSNLGVDNTNGDLKYETSPGGESNWEAGTTRLVVKQTGRVGIGSSTTVNYSLEQTGQTDAFGVARGTVAQRPTIVSSTTPFRYNTDSIALEYGESVGTWRQLATRSYARSLVSGLPTTWLKPALESGNVTINGTGKNFTVSNSKFQWGGRGYFGSDSTIHFFPDLQLIYVRGSIPRMYTSGTHPIYPAGYVMEHNITGGASYEWLVDRSTVVGLPNHTAQGLIRYQSSTYNHTINSLYPIGKKQILAYYGNTNGHANMLANFVFFVSDSTTNSDVFEIRSRDNGNILVGKDNGTWRVNKYGTGTKEAADLSKTQSNYIAGFATDGTVLDLNVDTLLKKEKYFTITSTSSPQTLSNNFSDNLINQGGTQAAFTLKFPASPVDGQVLKITYNNAITTLTLDGNGNTIVGSAVTTGVAGSQRAFKFYTGIGWIKQY